MMRVPCSACGKPIREDKIYKVMPLMDNNEQRYFCSKRCRIEYTQNMQNYTYGGSDEPKGDDTIRPI